MIGVHSTICFKHIYACSISIYIYTGKGIGHGRTASPARSQRLVSEVITCKRRTIIYDAKICHSQGVSFQITCHNRVSMRLNIYEQWPITGCLCALDAESRCFKGQYLPQKIATKHMLRSKSVYICLNIMVLIEEPFV